jgi:hypothetical protein
VGGRVEAERSNVERSIVSAEIGRAIPLRPVGRTWRQMEGSTLDVAPPLLPLPMDGVTYRSRGKRSLIRRCETLDDSDHLYAVSDVGPNFSRERQHEVPVHRGCDTCGGVETRRLFADPPSPRRERTDCVVRVRAGGCPGPISRTDWARRLE